MIEYSNQFKMMFSIASYEDFIDEENLEELKIVEQAGNVMPMLQLTFKTNNSKHLMVLNENNFGRSLNPDELEDLVYLYIILNKVNRLPATAACAPLG